jgi:hypothetical protein
MTAPAMARTETAAEEYARLRDEQFEKFLNDSFSEESLKNAELFEVKVPVTGKVFKCRKPGQDFLANVGAMPVALTSRVATQDGPAQDGQEVYQSMSPVERRASIEVTAQLVRYIAVEPRLIVGEVNGHKNAISVDVLSTADFNHLASWASGGDAAEGLKTFRRKRR